MSNLIEKVKTILCLHYINMSLSRAAATIPLRAIDSSNPNSWEFSGFSQNNEDGIIDYLAGRTKAPNRYFVEIGSGNGLENNTSWLAIAKKYSGLMIEGNKRLSDLCKLIIASLNISVDCRCMLLTKESVKQFLGYVLYDQPDVFSLDIDGNDYYIARILMESGFRPKIFVAEYNAVFGPERSITINYKEDFNLYQAHQSFLYYGVGIAGWKKFFKSFGYRFVTVDSKGVNAFFVNPEYFDKDFLDNLKGLQFQENHYQLNKFKMTWEKQFGLIESMDYVEI